MSNTFTFQVFPTGNYSGSYTLTPVSGGATVSGSLASSVTTQLSDGAYTLNISATGYEDVIQSVNGTDGTAVVPMTLLQDNTSVGLPSGNALIPANNPSTPITTNNPIPSPEFVAPNSDYGKYFMATDARIYIGGVFIDEVDFVQYVLQANQIPIYPYRSSLFTAMGQGRSLVQGQLAINFISEGYLYAVLDNYNNTPSVTTATQDLQTELNSLQVAKANVGSNLSVLPGSSIDTTDNQDQLDQINQRITTILSSMGTSAASALSTSTSYASGVANADTTFCNPVYQSGPFDIVANFTGGGRTVTRKIENCFLISNEQVVSRDGKVLMDVYGFIARRLR